MMMQKQDQYPPVSVLKALVIPAANTEIVVFDTTKIKDIGGADQLGAAFGVRQSAGYLKRAFLSVFADQALTAYLKHLAATDTGVVGNWHQFGAGTATTGGSLSMVPLHLFGDDHQIILKTGGTPPTSLVVSLRFSLDQALAE